MQVIIFNNIDDFNQLEQSIHNALKLGIENYNAERWAEPIYSLDRTKIACPIELEGQRGAIIQPLIEGYEITDLQPDNTEWFEKIEFPL